jgi:succinate dehydrogenase/fumarate reductase flavoprotein subunit
MQKEKEVDVIVVGGGGGGMRAAIAAAEKGATVALLCKGKSGRSGSAPMAGAGLMGDIDTDGPTLKNLGFEADESYTSDVWFKDIILAGGFLNNQKIVRRHIEESKNIVRELIQWGTKAYSGWGLGSNTNALSVNGINMMDVLKKKAQSLNVLIRDDVLVTDVVADGVAVNGVIATDVHEGSISYWPSKVVILATGGVHGLYDHNTGASCTTGDGLTMAHRAGADLLNLEMIEFVPDVVVTPQRLKGSCITYVLAAHGGAEYENSRGESFVEKYYNGKTLDLALHSEWNKMLFSYAMFKEGLDAGYVRVKIFPDRLETAYDELPYLKPKSDFFKKISKWELITRPAAHYMVGGISIDENCATNVDGLFACGENSFAVFGANRVSSALTEMLTLGKIAGETAGEYVKNSTMKHNDSKAEALIAENITPFKGKGESTVSRVFDIYRNLRLTMDKNVNVVKNESSLKSALADISLLEESFASITMRDSPSRYDVPWLSYLNLRNMLPLAKFMVKASLQREESRGVFVRDDRLFTDNENWLKCTRIKPSGELDIVEPVLSELRPDFDKLPYFDAINHLAERVG